MFCIVCSICKSNKKISLKIYWLRYINVIGFDEFFLKPRVRRVKIKAVRFKRVCHGANCFGLWPIYAFCMCVISA